jgi:hypothetical protein
MITGTYHNLMNSTTVLVKYFIICLNRLNSCPVMKTQFGQVKLNHTLACYGKWLSDYWNFLQVCPLHRVARINNFLILEKTYQIARTTRLPAAEGIYWLVMYRIYPYHNNFSCFNCLNERVVIGNQIRN